MLSASEKENLYHIIRATIGDDISIKRVRHSFNENTVSVVEKMIKANANCNQNMKTLVVELIGANAVLAKGWLRTVLKKSSDSIKKTTLNGYACLAGAKSRWATAIIISTY